ncbi:hypothetical protein K491DRAFT_682179 [Lophiostoma macrostomum CBS 122681]|uniref:Uncharacterized protein n=1 Tax=Lophiostoma macrostomum CBS 122681 TaxID=1314788 RepID=A0A6A6SWR3_9PLEO|nr:hypothetical protein K491DRAFT_682179 [Lophiostoma macrostomum CBS 122681]
MSDTSFELFSPFPPERGRRRWSGTYYDDDARILMRERQHKFQGTRRASIATSTVPLSADPDIAPEYQCGWPRALSKNVARIEESWLTRVVCRILDQHSLFTAAQQHAFLLKIIIHIVQCSIEMSAVSEECLYPDWWYYVQEEVVPQIEDFVNFGGMHADIFEAYDELSELAFLAYRVVRRVREVISQKEGIALAELSREAPERVFISSVICLRYQDELHLALNLDGLYGFRIDKEHPSDAGRMVPFRPTPGQKEGPNQVFWHARNVVEAGIAATDQPLTKVPGLFVLDEVQLDQISTQYPAQLEASVCAICLEDSFFGVQTLSAPMG